MSSIFSFLRGRSGAPGTEPTAEPLINPATIGALATDASAGPPTVSETAVPPTPPPAAAFRTAVLSSIPHAAPSLPDVLTAMRTALETYLPSPGFGLPAPNISIIKIQEKPTGLGNYIGETLVNQFSQVIKGGRLQATVRFHLWATAPNDADLAIDDLHGRLLTAKDDLWLAGFLRFVSLDSSLPDHVSSLNVWRRTADYDVLYEYRYTDADGAQSLIARIPIHTDPEEPDSPNRETAVVTDAMARWDNLAAPTLDLRGRQTISGFTALTFIPGSSPTAPVVLRRTFAGAPGAPTDFTDVEDWITAVTHPTVPNRHAQLTFATLAAFLAAFSPVGDPITLGDWDEDATLDDYAAHRLDLPTPIVLPAATDHLQLVYQPGSTDPRFDETAVLYIRAI
jgi:hypothetical protein